VKGLFINLFTKLKTHLSTVGMEVLLILLAHQNFRMEILDYEMKNRSKETFLRFQL